MIYIFCSFISAQVKVRCVSDMHQGHLKVMWIFTASGFSIFGKHHEQFIAQDLRQRHGRSMCILGQQFLLLSLISFWKSEFEHLVYYSKRKIIVL